MGEQPQHLRIATRGSELALAQAAAVGEALRQCHPELSTELVVMTTRGDREKGPLADVGGKGLFTAELEAALRGGRAHLAVHSAKDLPAAMDEDLVIVAVPPREDARDALVSPGGCAAAELPAGARVGTSSLRRSAQVLAMRPDLTIVPLRGNVPTRVRKVLDLRQLDAAVLAMAGLIRLGAHNAHRANIHPLTLQECTPAAGQGALALQCLAASEAAEIVRAIDDAPSRAALEAERAVLRALGAQCNSCLGVHVAPGQGRWMAMGMAARADGSGMIRLREEAPSAAAAGDALLKALLSNGAQELLAS
ncbi:MAG: hydroxymethylbilane synthase [Planctomycetaceae bacterium]|nr:hydroxymethylbilane synthase [Planctomycetaceae bacterium]